MDEIRKEIEELKGEVYKINCRIVNLERQLEGEKSNLKISSVNENRVERPVLRIKEDKPVLTRKTPNKEIMTPRKDIESNLGKNIMVIFASLLIFIGLSGLIVLLFDNISDILKLTLIYLFTLGFSGYGLYLVNKKRNAFTLGLSSCGLGSVYISILLTYFVYSYINEIVLFILLMLWSVFIAFMNNRLKSDIYIFISSLGILVALFLGFSYESTIFLYSVLFLSYFISGYYFCIYTKLKNIYLQLYLNLVYILPLTFILDNYLYSDIENLVMTVGYFILIPVFSYLSSKNFISVSMELNHKYKELLSGILIFISLLVLNFCSIGNFIYTNPITGKYVDVIAGVVLYLLLLGSVYYFDELLIKIEKGSLRYFILGFIVSIIHIFLLNELDEFSIYLVSLIFLVLPLLLISVHHSNKLYIILSLLSLTISSMYMSDNSYFIMQDGYPIYLIIVGLLFLAIIVGIFNRLDIKWKLDEISFLSIISSLYMSLDILFYDYYEYRIILIMIVSLSILLIHKLFKDRMGKYTFDLIKFFNGVFLLWSLYEMYETEMGVLLLSIASIVTIIQSIVYLGNLFKERQKYSGFYIGVKLTTYILILLSIYLKTFNDIGYIYSVVLILLAIVFILVGFKLKHKEFRLYGLVLSFIGVFKLVLIDISYTNSISRVLSFIFAGVLCFIISFIYTKMSEKNNN